MVEKKRTRNIKEKIDLIYKTFFDLVLKKGYNKTNTNLVAETAQISIGTVYRYFPNGKSDIILNYFENSKDIVFNIEDFEKIREPNFVIPFERFIRNNLENQKKNPGYHIAFRQAIMSDRELLGKYKNKIAKINTEIVRKLRASSPIFRAYSEQRLIKGFGFIFNLIQANIFHHLYIMKVFDDEEYFIKFLSNLVEYARGYIQNENPFIIDRDI